MSSKLDQIRVLRERQYAERAADPSPNVIYGGSVGGGMGANVNKTSDKPILLTRNAAHQARWRKANPELNRQRAREGMRKLREADASA